MARRGVLFCLALCLALASASDAGRALLEDSSIIPTAGAAPLANGNGDVLATGALLCVVARALSACSELASSFVPFQAPRAPRRAAGPPAGAR